MKKPFHRRTETPWEVTCHKMNCDSATLHQVPVLSKLWCLTSTETIRLIRDGENVGEGGMEVGEVGEYISIATLSPPEWLALRWAAMRAIQLMSRFIICEGQSHKTLSTFMSCKRSRIKLSSDWSGRLGWGCLLFFGSFFCCCFFLFFFFLTGSCHWCARFRLKPQALVYDILLPKAMLEVWLWLRVLYPQGTEDKKSSLSLGYQGKDNSSWISSLVLCGATQVKLKS